MAQQPPTPSAASWNVASLAVISTNDHLLFSRVYIGGAAVPGLSPGSFAAPLPSQPQAAVSLGRAVDGSRAPAPAAVRRETAESDDLLRAVEEAFGDAVDEAQTLQFIMYGARDFVAENLEKHRLEVLELEKRRKANDGSRGAYPDQPQITDAKYFGKQMTMGGYDTYAYVLGSKAHVILAVRGAAPDHEVKLVLQSLAEATSLAMAGPFRAVNDDLGRSEAFQRRVADTLHRFMPPLTSPPQSQ
jgi:hypothetical protein